MSTVTLRYQPGAEVPEHLRAVLRVRALTLKAGEPVSLSASDAAMVIHGAPKGSVKIIDGEPDAAWEPKAPRARDLARRAARRAEEVGVDPVALASLQPIPPADLDALRAGGRPAQKAIAKLSAGRAADVAIWARLGGRQEVSEMAEARCREATAADQRLSVQVAAG